MWFCPTPWEERAVFSLVQRAERWYRAPSFQQEPPEGVLGTQPWHHFSYIHVLVSPAFMAEDILTVEPSVTTIVATRLWRTNTLSSRGWGSSWRARWHFNSIWTYYAEMCCTVQEKSSHTITKAEQHLSRCRGDCWRAPVLHLVPWCPNNPTR